MLKLFDNVKELHFGRGQKFVEGMSSSEGEGFSFRNNTPVEGPVEGWMTLCEAAMHARFIGNNNFFSNTLTYTLTLSIISLRDITKEGVFEYASYPRTEWLKRVLGEITTVILLLV
jgi:hypothetical protein